MCATVHITCSMETASSMMYDPREPNVYHDVQYAYYCARRAEEANRNSSACDQNRACANDTDKHSTQSSSGGSRSNVGAVYDAAFLSSSQSVTPTTATSNEATDSVMPPPSARVPVTSSSTSARSAAARSMMSPNLTAEELHNLRIKRSADMGVQRAVELQREGLEVEHKKRKLEGTDARSKISSLLSKMRRPALAASSSAEVPQTASSASCSSALPGETLHSPGTVSGCAIGYDVERRLGDRGEPDSVHSDAASSHRARDSASCESAKNDAIHGVGDRMSAPAAPTAQLVFRPSPLAAGGFVMTAAAPSSSSSPSAAEAQSMRRRGHTSLAGAAVRSLRGKPSSTLLVRYGCASLLPSLLGEDYHEVESTVPDANKSETCISSSISSHYQCVASISVSRAQTALLPLLEQLRREAGQYGVVCSARVHVLDESEVSAMRATLVKRVCVAAPDSHVCDAQKKESQEDETSRQCQAVCARRALCERVRLFLRFDSVAGAFKAAEEMIRRGADNGVLAQRSIDFFCTALYDSDRLGPTEAEALCTSE